ncbi:hypothetical protein M422DRAFT_215002, partial [Sphaerobolus stellatus SS14]
MSRVSGGVVWRVARQNIPNLPECPPDMSEAQYAQALFTFECQVCNVAPVEYMTYWLRTRLCDDCVQQQIQTGVNLLNTIPELTESLLRTLHSTAYPYRHDDQALPI